MLNKYLEGIFLTKHNTSVLMVRTLIIFIFFTFMIFFYLSSVSTTKSIYFLFVSSISDSSTRNQLDWCGQFYNYIHTLIEKKVLGVPAIRNTGLDWQKYTFKLF